MAESFQDNYAFSLAVTADFLQEFKLLRYSLELFHGSDFHWFIRCDRPTAEVFANDPCIHCSAFVEALPCVIPPGLPEYRLISEQRLLAVSEAWNYGQWDAVIALDADLLFTAPVLSAAAACEGELVLSPHYCPPRREAEERQLGLYNAGFVVMRSKNVSDWWLDSLRTGSPASDQKLLEAGEGLFRTSRLGPEANIGVWRAPQSLDFPPVPQDCLFFHVQLFQPACSLPSMVQKIFANSLLFGIGQQEYRPAFNAQQLAQRSFGAHILAHLRDQSCQRLQALVREILERDRLGLYAARFAL